MESSTIPPTQADNPPSSLNLDSIPRLMSFSLTVFLQRLERYVLRPLYRAMRMFQNSSEANSSFHAPKHNNGLQQLRYSVPSVHAHGNLSLPPLLQTLGSKQLESPTKAMLVTSEPSMSRAIVVSDGAETLPTDRSRPLTRLPARRSVPP